MTKQESIDVFNDMKSTFADAVASVAIRMSDNVTLTVSGIRSNESVTRTLASNNGLADTVDTTMIVLASDLQNIGTLRGKSAVITYAAVDTAVRLISTKAHALGGLVILMCGDYDKVAQ